MKRPQKVSSERMEEKDKYAIVKCSEISLDS